MKIVTPDWIVRSVQAKACIDERQFHPRLLHSTLDRSLSEKNPSSLSDDGSSLCSVPGSQHVCKSSDGADNGIAGQPEHRTDPAADISLRLSLHKFSTGNATALTAQSVTGASLSPNDVSKLLVSTSSTPATFVSQRVMPLVSTAGLQPRSHLRSIGNSSEILARISKNSSKAVASAKVRDRNN